MQKVISYFKNKYRFALMLFFMHAIFLDDVTIFDVASQYKKLGKLNSDEVLLGQKLEETTATLNNLGTTSGIERYAREEKLYKRDNEDVFVISYE